jgi:hypothetical protein
MSGTVQIIVALIAALPALVAAIVAADTRRHVDTKNGRKIGAYVVEAQQVLQAVSEALGQVQQDIKPPSGDSIGQVTERTHDIAAANSALLIEQAKPSSPKADV